jgi:hypothetical protein
VRTGQGSEFSCNVLVYADAIMRATHEKYPYGARVYEWAATYLTVPETGHVAWNRATERAA